MATATDRQRGRMSMAIYKCKDCPYFEKKGSWPGTYFYCNKFKTTVDYNKSACADMKGK
jgi:hypothetical protein